MPAVSMDDQDSDDFKGAVLVSRHADFRSPQISCVDQRAVSVAEAATIATVAMVQTVRSSFIDMLRFRTGPRDRTSSSVQAPNGQLFVVRPIATKLWFRDQ
jgi:hypothetical protein